MLRRELRAQVVARKAHAGARLRLLLAGVGAASGKAQRAEQHARHEREQRERDQELDQREAARMRTLMPHVGFLGPILTVASDSVRSRPSPPL